MGYDGVGANRYVVADGDLSENLDSQTEIHIVTNDDWQSVARLVKSSADDHASTQGAVFADTSGGLDPCVIADMENHQTRASGVWADLAMGAGTEMLVAIPPKVE